MCSLPQILDIALITDVFATGYHAAVMADVSVGKTVYIAGAGPVGLACAGACCVAFVVQSILVFLLSLHIFLLLGILEIVLTHARTHVAYLNRMTVAESCRLLGAAEVIIGTKHCLFFFFCLLFSFACCCFRVCCAL